MRHMLVDDYISELRNVKRYSERTVDIYSTVLRDYVSFVSERSESFDDEELVDSLNPSEIREYEMRMLDSDPPMSPRTVSLHMSALSGFCRYLMKKGKLKSNPVKLVTKPKLSKDIPHFFRKESLDDYFSRTEHFLDDDELSGFIREWDTETGKGYYESLLSRLIISTLYSLGLRRSELIAMKISDVDFGRKVVKVRGKGNKMREIPLVVSLSEEILLYLKAVEAMCGGKRSLNQPLFVTYKGSAMYPAYVDRAVKSELKDFDGFNGRKSPHVLRHSLATELLNQEADLYSIKEVLGHSSLAATQVYTHSSIARLKDIYEQAHPRAKNGGKHGD